jgi:regulator of extracellular matrix RemA (YlzA/DUF370 family)
MLLVQLVCIKITYFRSVNVIQGKSLGIIRISYENVRMKNTLKNGGKTRKILFVLENCMIVIYVQHTTIFRRFTFEKFF